MKRAKFVLLVVVAALVLMGAGYAAWTQTFTISSTVSAGELFVKVDHENTGVTVETWDPGSEKFKGVPVGGNYGEFYLNTEDADNVVSVEQGTSSSDGEQTLASIKYSLGDIYPGTKITSTISFENLGTLKVKTSGRPVLDQNTDTGLLGYMNITVKNSSGLEITFKSTENAATLEDLAEAISDAVGVLDVKNGNAKFKEVVTLEMELPFETSDNSTERLRMEWTIDLQFEQYNG